MRRVRASIVFVVLVVLASAIAAGKTSGQSFADVIAEAQPKVAKIYGAGGFRGLEAYQSGFLISSEGHVLTAWSYVLDTDEIIVVLDDGRRYKAELMGIDPRIEIAILKIEVRDLPYFNLDKAEQLTTGDRVLALSNLYGVATGNEPSSVQHGSVSALTKLTGRKGALETPYRGDIYVIDAMTNNAGAAGGVLTDSSGRIAGILGKELRDARSNVWLNYAIPIASIREAVDDLLAGKLRPRGGNELQKTAEEPWRLADIGIQLIPNLLPRTPPFVHTVFDSSPAQAAELNPDDLIIFVENQIVRSINEVIRELSLYDRQEPIELIVQRDQQLIPIKLRPAPIN